MVRGSDANSKSFLKGREWGRGVGWGEACGACDRNTCMRNREGESAILLWVPGMCCADTVKLYLAAKRKRVRRRDIT